MWAWRASQVVRIKAHAGSHYNYLGIAMNPMLTHLSLSYCSLDDGAAVPLQLIIGFINTQITYLNLEGNFLGQTGKMSY